MHRVAVGVLALGGTLAIGALVVSGVLAHADYDRSSPARDEVVATAPETVDVWFTQEVFKREGANYVRVLDEAGQQVSEGDGVVDDDDRTHISTTLQPGLPDGRYTVEWKSLSDIDGDEAEGAFCFYVAVEPTEDQAAECAELAGEDEETPAATEASETPVALVTPTETVGADDDGDGSNTGLIIGVIAGAAAAAVVIGGAIVWLRKAG